MDSDGVACDERTQRSLSAEGKMSCVPALWKDNGKVVVDEYNAMDVQ